MSGGTATWTDLTSARHATSCTGTGFDRLDFTYDGEGHRTRIVETPMAGSPITTRDLRYQADAVVEESVNTVIVRSTIVDDAGAPTKLVVTNSGSANGTYLPTWNGHGDLLALWQVQADGTLVLAASVTYDTWGKPNVTTANGIGDLGWSRLYVGRSDVWWDNAFGAGLLYMHARTYSPTLGRFLQPDPVAAEGNLYGYAGNSPITKADPSGRFWYRVRRGDSLEGLSRRFWGNPNHIRAIVAANVGRIAQRRSTIQPGQCINVPGYFGPRGLVMWQDPTCSPRLRLGNGPGGGCGFGLAERAGRFVGGSIVIVGGFAGVGLGATIGAIGLGESGGALVGTVATDGLGAVAGAIVLTHGIQTIALGVGFADLSVGIAAAGGAMAKSAFC